MLPLNMFAVKFYSRITHKTFVISSKVRRAWSSFPVKFKMTNDLVNINHHHFSHYQVTNSQELHFTNTFNPKALFFFFQRTWWHAMRCLLSILLYLMLYSRKKSFLHFFAHAISRKWGGQIGISPLFLFLFSFQNKKWKGKTEAKL